MPCQQNSMQRSDQIVSIVSVFVGTFLANGTPEVRTMVAFRESRGLDQDLRNLAPASRWE